jgi:hypothetical protein
LTNHVTPLYAAGVMRHPALQRIEETKERAAELRVELEAAEREHHEAIIEAVNLPSEDDPELSEFTIKEIAEAAGVSRPRIYKRLHKPVYGDRSAVG